ncbi:MAG: glycoside hydrolase family 38 C-terminal domain-containing protein, partial [Calditrichia bacterium]
LLPFNGWRRKISFMADLPQLGTAFYSIKAQEGEREEFQTEKSTEIRMDSSTGLINSYRTKNGKELLKGGCPQLLVIEDKCDAWGTDCWSYRKELGRFESDPQSIIKIENGLVRSIRQAIQHFGNSRAVINTIQYQNWPALEFRLRIHWREQQKRLKLLLPTRFDAGEVLCEILGGAARFPADGQEHVHGRWIILQDKDIALGIVHTGMHGFDFKEGELRLSVLRSAAYCHEQGFKLDAYPARKFMDQGEHEERLLLFSGSPAEVQRQICGYADWLTTPPFALAHLPMGVGEKTAAAELLRLKPQNIRLLACYPSGKNQLLFRLQETAGEKTASRIQLIHPAIEFELDFQPLEIKTLLLEKSGNPQELEKWDVQDEKS